MQCPRCRCHDVYRSRTAAVGLFSVMMVAVRCHRCCYLFSVPRWNDVPEKEARPEGEAQLRHRRVA
jgi:hypothetical protein